MKKYICFISLLLFSYVKVSAQESRSSLQALFQQMFNAEKLEMNLNIQAYESPNSKESAYNMNVIALKEGKRILYKMPSMSYLYGDNYAIMADDGNNILYVKPFAKGKDQYLAMPKEYLVRNLDSLITACDSIKKQKTLAGREAYRLYFQEGYYVYVDIEMEVGTHKPLKINYLYKPEYSELTYQTVTFQKFNANPTYEANTFSEKKWILPKGGTYVGIGTYQHYEVIVVHDEEETE